MDLRIVKTKQQIKQAFLSLRAQYLPEKIKVKDICERAMINKTTFYAHSRRLRAQGADRSARG